MRFPITLGTQRPVIAHVTVSSTLSGFLRDSVFLVLAKMSGAKVFAHVHGGFFENLWNSSGNTLHGYVRWSLGLCDRVAVLSGYWERFFAGFVDRKKLTVIENAVDCEAFSPAARRRDGGGNGARVLFVGSLGRNKGVYDILSCVRQIREEAPGTRFIFVGTEEIAGDEKRIQKFTDESGARSSVEFAGAKYGEDILECYRNSDFLVLPSYMEGLPLAILEAMASGLPVVASSAGAIPEVITDGRNGFLIDPGDRTALKEKILLLARDRELRKRIGETNKKDVAERFDISVMARKIEAVYRELLPE